MGKRHVGMFHMWIPSGQNRDQYCWYLIMIIISYRHLRIVRDLVRSIFEYGAVVWDPYQSRDIIAIEKVQRQAARFIKSDYKSRFEGWVTSMLEDLKLPILQQRRLETRLVMLYKVVRGMVPAINADEFLIPIRNKRHIKPRVPSDFHTTNIVKKFSTNYSECF